MAPVLTPDEVDEALKKFAAGRTATPAPGVLPTPTPIPQTTAPVPIPAQAPNQTPPQVAPVAVTPAEPSTPSPVAPVPSENKPELPNNITENGVEINDLMLWYAISGYIYAYTYLKTVADIQEAPDGHGIFNNISTAMIGILDNSGITKEATNINLDDIDKENLTAIKEMIDEEPDELKKQELIKQYSAILNSYKPETKEQPATI